MKQIILLISIFAVASSYSQVTLIPDMNFEQALINLGIDTDGAVNGQVVTADISDETTLTINGLGIFSLEGIQDFTSLEYLDCTANQISELNISNLTSLRGLACFSNVLTELDVSNLTQLETLDCESNLITSQDVTNNTLLRSLFVGSKTFDVGWHNNIATIDLSNNINLETFGCDYSSSLSNLDLISNVQLKTLYAAYCDLDELDLSNNSQLQGLYIGRTSEFTFPSNSFTSLDLSENIDLISLYAPRTNIGSLNLKNGANSILTSVELRINEDLFCVEVDNPVGANNGDTPYNYWDTEPQVYYQNDCSLGVDDFNQEKIAVLPNPAKNTLAVIALNRVIEKVKIYSLQGSQIIEVKTSFDRIDLTTLRIGMYLCAIQTDQGKFFKRIIKN
jgi:Leucine-rich repeat (LRR) protein